MLRCLNQGTLKRLLTNHYTYACTLNFMRYGYMYSLNEIYISGTIHTTLGSAAFSDINEYWLNQQTETPESSYLQGNQIVQSRFI